MSDVIVIGAGLAGLTAALRLRQAGRTVTLLTKGIGGLQLGQGTIDVLGYRPQLVASPLDELDAFVAEHPEHPYAVLGREAVEQGVAYLQELLGGELVGEPGANRRYPTAVGAMRPTALVPPSMAAGECVAGKRFLLVGIRELKDFYPQLVAENLSRGELPEGGHVEARAEHISFPARDGEIDSSGLNIARALDDPAHRARFVAALRPLVREGETVGLPAVLGARDPYAWREIQDALGVPVFEIPLPPPGVPGWRMNEALLQQVKDSRVRVVNGTKVLRARVEGGRVMGVTIKGTGREQEYTADEFVLAAGGFESGALVLDSHNELHESIFGLPVRGGRIEDMVHGDYWGGDQPLFKAGLAVDEQMRVLGPDGQIVHPNLRAAGGILAGAQRWSEKSGEGIALASALRAADAILANSKEN